MITELAAALTKIAGYEKEPGAERMKLRDCQPASSSKAEGQEHEKNKDEEGEEAAVSELEEEGRCRDIKG